MFPFFLACLVLGGAVLVLQMLASAMGVEHGGHDVAHDVPHEAPHGLPHGAPHAHPHGHAGAAGLDLLSVRALAAGVAFLGLGGLAALSAGLGAVPALVAGLAAGAIATVAVAAIMRSMLRLESDGTVAVAGAVGATGTVYLTIPGARTGPGKVHLALQGRTVELQAVTTEEPPIPTGASVLVVDVEPGDTVVVVRNPLLLEESHAAP
jgi:hypothetical protein